MLTALLLIVSMAQAPGDWRVITLADEAGTLRWRPAAEDAGGGDLRRALMRVESPELGWPAAEMDVQFACADQTFTIVAARAFDEAGALVRTVQPPPEQLRPERLYAGDRGHGDVYAQLCPDAAPLPERPVYPPPVAVPVPRGG